MSPKAFLGIGFALGVLGVVIVALITNIALVDDDHVTWPREGHTGGIEAASGALLVEQQGCTACHSTDGSPSSGPTWQALAGSERLLADGSTVVADAAYLRTSIVSPRAAVVDGFGAVMPTNYADALTTTEVDAIVAYLESLAPAE